MNSGHQASWQNPRILFTILGVFLCGVAVGMLTMSLGLHHLLHPEQTQVMTAGGKDMSLQSFKKELDLTPAQCEQLETILDDFFTYYHTLQAQLDDVRASGKQRILRVLDEKQKRKFEKLMGDSQQGQLR
jgi:hypothetical protein